MLHDLLFPVQSFLLDLFAGKEHLNIAEVRGGRYAWLSVLAAAKCEHTTSVHDVVTSSYLDG